MFVGIASIGAVLTMKIDPLYTGAILGYIYIFLATFVWDVYCVIIIRLIEKYEITILIFYQLLFTTIVTSPFLIIEKHSFLKLQITDILFLLFIFVIGVSLCYYFNAFSLKNISSMNTEMFMNIGPIIFTVFSSHISSYNIMDIIGIILIVIGVILAIKSILDKTHIILKE